MFNGKLYADLDQYVDLEDFDKLHYKICKGFSKARHLATIGNLDVNMENILTDGTYTHLCQSFNQYKTYPPTSEIKQISKDLNSNDLAVFLKFAIGGYDLYQTYFIEPLKDYFPEIYIWIENLKTNNIFSSITEAYFLTLDAGGIPFDHYHPDQGFAAEFIHIRSNIARPFYIKDSKTLEKTYIDSRVAWWDDRVIHGGDPVMFPTYTLRIDGIFTEQFRKKVLHG
jgi:hypothetical protein